MIGAGEVAVNGVIIDDLATKVVPSDMITVKGTRLPKPARARLWRHHKQRGCVTTHKDERGRRTVFEDMPRSLGRVHSIGRLDINSEGLLLLTNDGELKRWIELPATGWQRLYRVRAFGTPSEAGLQALREGSELDGVALRPMEITIERQTGRNIWLKILIREGKNREIRRTLARCGLTANRLIRVGYGPFRLAQLPRGDTAHVNDKALTRHAAAFFAARSPGGRN